MYGVVGCHQDPSSCPGQGGVPRQLKSHVLASGPGPSLSRPRGPPPLPHQQLDGEGSERPRMAGRGPRRAWSLSPRGLPPPEQGRRAGLRVGDRQTPLGAPEVRVCHMAGVTRADEEPVSQQRAGPSDQMPILVFSKDHEADEWKQPSPSLSLGCWRSLGWEAPRSPTRSWAQPGRQNPPCPGSSQQTLGRPGRTEPSF